MNPKNLKSSHPTKKERKEIDGKLNLEHRCK
jgi:hypothetical protein